MAETLVSEELQHMRPVLLFAVRVVFLAIRPAARPEHLRRAAGQVPVERPVEEFAAVVGVVAAIRQVGKKKSVERRYYLSSLPVDGAQLAKAVRGHWAVENQLHWVLDVVFGEDQVRARTGHAVANRACCGGWR